MRGAAPSIVCPRCDREAPPADALGQFTTCLGCGMVYPSAPRERFRPWRRKKAEPPPEPEVAEPLRDAPAPRPWPATWLLFCAVGVICIFVLIGMSDDDDKHEREVAAARYETEWRTDLKARLEAERSVDETRRRMQLEGEEKWNEFQARQLKVLENSPLEPCRKIAELVKRDWNCETPQDRAKLDGLIEIERLFITRGEGDLHTRCASTVHSIEAAAQLGRCR